MKDDAVYSESPSKQQQQLAYCHNHLQAKTDKKWQDDHYILVKGTIQQEETTIINIYTLMFLKIIFLSTCLQDKMFLFLGWGWYMCVIILVTLIILFPSPSTLYLLISITFYKKLSPYVLLSSTYFALYYNLSLSYKKAHVVFKLVYPIYFT